MMSNKQIETNDVNESRLASKDSSLIGILNREKLVINNHILSLINEGIDPAKRIDLYGVLSIKSKCKFKTQVFQRLMNYFMQELLLLQIGWE